MNCGICGMEYKDNVPHPPSICAVYARDALKKALKALDGALETVSRQSTRIDQLVGVIEKLRKCYNWDRSEYRSHLELVDAVEEALTLIRQAPRESS